jgi:hypothetical protein
VSSERAPKSMPAILIALPRMSCGIRWAREMALGTFLPRLGGKGRGEAGRLIYVAADVRRL